VPTGTATGAPSKSNNGGIYAGIAIGCLIGGFLLAGLLFFFLLRRTKRSQSARNYEQHSPPQAGAVDYSDKGFAVTTVASAAGVDKFLPQPVEDNKILNEMSNLRDKIKNHAQNYYHTNPVDASQLNQSALHEISRVIGLSTAVLQNTLLNPSTRVSGIRACIAGVIFSRFGGQKGIAGDSILPAEMASSADAFENSRDRGKTIEPDFGEVLHTDYYRSCQTSQQI
jgi:hypothetical protein